MENIGASVSAVLTQEKKQTELEKIVEHGGKYIRKENEVIFCLEEAPEYHLVFLPKDRKSTRLNSSH